MPQRSPQAAEILAMYFRMMGASDQSRGNPAPNPVSLERRHIEAVGGKSYVVLEKSDGNRYVLLLGRYTSALGGKPFSVMIDRRCDIYEVELLAPDTCYKGSLFDGELVKESHVDIVACGGGAAESPVSTNMFLVFDVMWTENRSCMNANYIARMEHAKRLFQGIEDGEKRRDLDARAWDGDAEEVSERQGMIMTTAANVGSLDVRWKPFYRSNLVGTLLRQRGELRHKSDGVILMPVDEPVQLKTHWTMYKWKDHHTFDFGFCVERDDVEPSGYRWGVFYRDGDRGETSGPVRSDGKAFELVLVSNQQKASCERLLAKSRKARARFVAECEAHIDDDAETLNVAIVKLRPEKTDPNNAYTIERTVTNLRENITAHELCEILHSDQTVLSVLQAGASSSSSS
jgi:hypothetical protein